MLLSGSMKAVIELFGNLEADRERYQRLSEAVEDIGMSTNYAEQMLTAGRRLGLIVTSKGPGGGYALAIPFQNITLGQILEVIEQINKRERKPFDSPTGERVNQALLRELRDRPLSEFLASPE